MVGNSKTSKVKVPEPYAVIPLDEKIYEFRENFPAVIRMNGDIDCSSFLNLLSPLDYSSFLLEWKAALTTQEKVDVFQKYNYTERKPYNGKDAHVITLSHKNGDGKRELIHIIPKSKRVKNEPRDVPAGVLEGLAADTSESEKE